MATFTGLLIATGALLLWEGRGMTFFNADDLKPFATVTWSPEVLLEPENGHLVVVKRLLFHGVQSTIGPEYWVLRVFGVVGVLVMDGLFFVLARRRVGPSIALAATLPVLVFGSAWEAILWPTAQLALVCAIAAGLGAFLALEEDKAGRDLIACGLLILSLASFSIGICFAVGVGVSVMLRSDRWRRAWVFALPLALWCVWWLWARRFGSGNELLGSNVSRLPAYFWHSLEAVAGALTGLRGVGVPGVSFRMPPAANLSYGPILGLATGAVALLLVRRRGSIPRTLWPPLVTVLTYWALTGLAPAAGRGPEASRYMLVGILLILVAADLARGIRVQRTGLAALYAGAVIAATLNLAVLRQAHEFFVDYSDNARAQLAMLELAGPKGRPDFNPGAQTPAASSPFLLIRTGDYQRGVASYGSIADTLAQVEASPERTRERADEVLARALGLQLLPTTAPHTSRRCKVATSQRPLGRVAFALPRGGATLRADGPSVVVLDRFGGRPTAAVGLIAPGRWENLAIPADRASRPWSVTALGAERLDICPLAT